MFLEKGDNNTCLDDKEYYAGKSLFVVVPKAPNADYEEFSKKVRDYNEKPPFNFLRSKILGLEKVNS